MNSFVLGGVQGDIRGNIRIDINVMVNAVTEIREGWLIKGMRYQGGKKIRSPILVQCGRRKELINNFRDDVIIFPDCGVVSKNGLKNEKMAGE